MKAPYSIFGKTKLLEVETYTNGHKDEIASATWRETIWVERGEDWYALTSNSGTVRVIEREKWLRAPEIAE